MTIQDFREIPSIDPGRFRVASDFSIEVAARAGGLGTVLRLVDSGIDVCIEFPWWGNAEEDISNWTLHDIPLGTVTEPYWDADQGWRILIWKANATVFIASGSSDEDDTYDTFISVVEDRYRKAWVGVIGSSRS
ncbi:hypothetical protein GCM10023193_01040 [Planotetraspora kaengkrachanensis]